jgi:hypothetical protein
MRRRSNYLTEKIRESVSSVLPVSLTVFIICFTFVPVSAGLMLSFIIGTLLLIIGMSFFTLGAETAMTPLGKSAGTMMARSKSLWFILLFSFFIGVMTTLSEPDLQVLSASVPHINTAVLIVTVAVGVGLFLVVSMVRIIMGKKLKWLLLVLYTLVFILAFMSDTDYISVAFDAGGVTTGPMTVPFIMALGIGVADVRSDKKAEEDSFGLMALCSIGPVLAVMVLGFFYPGKSVSAAGSAVSAYESTTAISSAYVRALPQYMGEVFLSLAPITVFFLIFQKKALHLEKHAFARMMIGIAYTYTGLVLFLTGVNVGFSPVGTVLGRELASGVKRHLLVPLGMLIGWFIISAEPAVHVLTGQVEEITAGAIPAKKMGLGLSAAVSLASGLAMYRVISGIPILWFLVPGYAIALILSFFVPPIFTAIAFDSGGVASGTMTATFMLPLAVGASEALGGSILSDAFGLVALVAMTPLITIQVMGAVYAAGAAKTQAGKQMQHEKSHAYPDIVELWEDA